MLNDIKNDVYWSNMKTTLPQIHLPYITQVKFRNKHFYKNVLETL